MATMICKQIYLEPEQDAQLRKLAGETGQSEAELIRQALDRHMLAMRQRKRDVAAWVTERAFIEQLIAEAAPPAPRQWTRDELYDC